MKPVLVDIDGTLIPGPSTERRFYRYLRQREVIGWRAALRFAGFTVRYLPRYGKGVLRKNKAYLAGLPLAEVEVLASEFVVSVVSDELFQPLGERLREHRERGDDVWLLSGTLEPIARAIAHQLRIENVVATRCQLDHEVFLALPPEVHPYGRAKLELASELCQDLAVPLQEVVAYADSWADRFLLDAVGEPVAVMPDSKLRARAQQQGWEILDRPSQLPGQS